MAQEIPVWVKVISVLYDIVGALCVIGALALFVVRELSHHLCPALAF